MTLVINEDEQVSVLYIQRFSHKLRNRNLAFA